MRPAHLLLAVLLLGTGALAAPARPRARSAAVVADLALDEGNPDPARRAPLLLIAGWSAERGWLRGQQARGIMPRGARLSLYHLTHGVVGEAQANGRDRVLANDTEGGGLTTGTEVGTTLLHFDLPAGEARRTEVLAAWQTSGASPRWVKGRVLDPSDPPCRRLASGWLQQQKVPASLIAQASPNSAIAADINRDGREELFVTVGSPGHREKLLGPGKPTRSDFSYLLMQYTPRGAHRPETVIVAQSVPFDYEIRGFCDLNGDGWAEIIAREEITDSAMSVIYHWNGRRFERTEGWSFSV